MPDFTSGVLLGRPRHIRRMSLAQLEALAVGLKQAAARVSKAGVAVVKRKASPGHQTPRLIVIAEAGWCRLTGAPEPEPLPAETLAPGWRQHSGTDPPSRGRAYARGRQRDRPGASAG